MIESIDTIVAIGGVLIGFIFGRRERNLRAPIAHRCECGHSLSMHKDRDRMKDQRCMKGRCACHQYIGTRPMNLDIP